MVGFGPEDNHFVSELTYNYGIGEYHLGNDFLVSHPTTQAVQFWSMYWCAAVMMEAVSILVGQSELNDIADIMYFMWTTFSKGFVRNRNTIEMHEIYFCVCLLF